MKKNLKKVISAVLALTLAMSSFVALTTTAAADETATAGFPDVESTETYAEAVYALKALGVIVGDENGNFNPDNTITRAEVAVMAVAAQNLTDDAKASSASTKFADVTEKADWATGYVNVGVNNGFFSGKSETVFDPTANMTYVEVLSMLTRMLNYGDLATARGGWPDGYIWAASQSGIIAGVNAGQNDELTRSQVAQLIWNTVRAPKLAAADLAINITNGTMEKLDGTDGKNFETILSSKFDAYWFAADVTATSKSSGASLEKGNVSLLLTGKNDWDPEEEDIVKNVTGSDDAATTNLRTKSPVAVGNTDAENYLFASGKVLASYDDGDWEIIYFAPSSTAATKAIDGTLVADKKAAAGTDKGVNNFDSNNMVLTVNRSKTSTSNPTKYKLSTGAELYVNGYKLYTFNSENADAILAALKASTGDAVLYEDANGNGTTYNKVMIDVYALANVNQVRTSGDDVTIRLTNSVYPLDSSKSLSSSITIDAEEVADGDMVVAVSGTVTDAAQIEKDNIIAIKYDFNLGTKVDEATDIEIIVTNETVSGQYTSLEPDKETFAVAGTDYEASLSKFTSFEKGLERGSSYTFKLDPFGKLFSYEKEASSTMYAIVERIYDQTKNQGSYDNSWIQVMTLDGQSKRLEIYDGNNKNTKNTIFGILTADITTGSDVVVKDEGLGFKSAEKAAETKVPLEERIISYTVRSNGLVNSIEKVPVEAIGGTGDYNSNAGKIGDKRVASAATVLDASKYDDDAKTGDFDMADYKASSMSSLVSNVTYNGFVVGKNASTGSYDYVILTSTGAIYGPDSNFAIAAEVANPNSAEYLEDMDVYTLKVVDLDADGSVSKLQISEDVIVYNGDTVVSYAKADEIAKVIKKSAVFFYTTDADGYVDRINVVYNGGNEFDTVATSAEAALINKLTTKETTIQGDDWVYTAADNKWESTAKNEIQMFFAPVVLSSGSSVTFGAYGVDKDGYSYIDTNVDNTFVVPSDANLYAVDLADGLKDCDFGAGSFGGGLTITDANTAGYAYFSTDAKSVPVKPDVYGDDFQGQFQVAFVMAVDGIITNAVIFND